MDVKKKKKKGEKKRKERKKEKERKEERKKKIEKREEEGKKTRTKNERGFELGAAWKGKRLVEERERGGSGKETDRRQGETIVERRIK